MQEPERRPEARAVPQGERAETMGVVTPMMRGAYVPAWYSRVSWGGVLAGVLIAIGAQLVLSSIGVLVGFGTATVTNITDLRNISAAVGIWTAISALIALFIGAWAASSIGSVQFTSDGLWHGATVWALALVASILLTTVGVSGLLGFAGNVASALRGVIPTGATVTPSDIRAAADTVATSAGYFLLGALISLGAALLGGWFGSRRLSRAEAMEEARRERMAA